WVEVEHGLLGQLLGVEGPRPAAQDDPAADAVHLQVADPATRPALDLPSDHRGQVVPGLAPARRSWLPPPRLRRHGEPPCRGHIDDADGSDTGRDDGAAAASRVDGAAFELSSEM